MRVICLEKRWTHHAGPSGYSRLSGLLDARVIKRFPPETRGQWIAHNLWQLLFGQRRPYLLDYHLGDRWAEEKAFWLALAWRAQIIHVLYGDEQLDVLLHRAPLLPCHLVATFHLPSSGVRERFERLQAKQLQRLAGAIVLSSREVATYQAWLGSDKVLYVPHGIHVERIPTGAGHHGAGLSLVMVGFHMRDMELTRRVVERCAQERIDAVIHMVVPAEHHATFRDCDNVRLHGRLSDAALFELYGSVDALFLPLTDATANCALLEALACGTPVISTHVGGVPDYVDDSCGWLLPPGDVDAAIACIRRLAENRNMARALRGPARAQAERFAWPRIAADIKAAYRRLVRGQPFAG